MLKIVCEPGGVPYGELMQIYAQTIAAEAQLRYNKTEKNRAILWAEQDFFQYVTQCFFCVTNAKMYFWQVGERLVSCCRSEPFLDGILLTALETCPSERRKGYGESLVKAMLDIATTPVYAHIHRDNLPSLFLHRKCGFEPALEYADMLDGTKRFDHITVVKK